MSRKLYMCFQGAGDSLLFNTICFHLGRTTGRTFLVGTPHPEIFKGNPHVRHLPCKVHRIAALWRRALLLLGIVDGYEYLNYYTQGKPPPKHILSILCEQMGLAVTPKRPVICLTAEEKSRVFLPEAQRPWLGIQSIGNSVHTQYKNWSAEKFQEVATALRPGYSIVQFGLREDPPLEVDLNLCGKVSIREAFLALRQCRAFIGQEGFLMHSATAVGVPSVIVYGGFIAPWQSGYDSNINLYNALPCAPCWLWKQTCPYDKRCMAEISPQQVLKAFEELMSRPTEYSGLF